MYYIIIIIISIIVINNNNNNLFQIRYKLSISTSIYFVSVVKVNSGLV